MKKYIFIILTLIQCSINNDLISQDLLSNTYISIGGCIHEVRPFLSLFGPGYKYTAVSPEIGISYKFEKAPLSINYRRNFNYGSFVNKDFLSSLPIDYSDYSETNELNFYYHHSIKNLNLRFGTGYFNKKRITAGYFRSGGTNAFHASGFSLSTAFDLKNVSIEFKKYFQVIPYFDVFEHHLYVISVSRYMPLVKSKKIVETSSSHWDNFFPFFSVRMQAIEYAQQNNDLFHRVGIAPGIGFGYHFPNLNASVIVSRDVWKRFTGGAFGNDLIGYISTSNIMVKKYLPLENGKELILGLGWHPIRNANEPDRMRSRVFIRSDTGQPYTHTFPRRTNMFGVGTSIGYSLNKNYEVEFRHIFPYLGEQFFTPWHSSIGVIYNWK